MYPVATAQRLKAIDWTAPEAKPKDLSNREPHDGKVDLVLYTVLIFKIYYMSE